MVNGTTLFSHVTYSDVATFIVLRRLTDAISLEYMRRQKLKLAIVEDEHFRREGVKLS